MTKKELIEALAKYPDDYEIYKGYHFYNGRMEYVEETMDEIYPIEMDGKTVILIS